MGGVHKCMYMNVNTSGHLDDNVVSGEHKTPKTMPKIQIVTYSWILTCHSLVPGKGECLQNFVNVYTECNKQIATV